MKILIIDNYDSFTYILGQMLEQSGNCSVDIIKNDNNDIISYASAYNKIVFSPGPGLPSDSPSMYRILEQCYHQKSILGICLGHQAIAQFFGAELCNLPYPQHGKISKLNILSSDEYLFENIIEPIKVGRYHSWVVSKENFPACLQITSVSEEGLIMSLRHKDYDVRGIQFHPESYMTPSGLQMLENWIKKSRF